MEGNFGGSESGSHNEGLMESKNRYMYSGTMDNVTVARPLDIQSCQVAVKCEDHMFSFLPLFPFYPNECGLLLHLHTRHYQWSKNI